jgi:hypothetical protein
MFAWKVARRGGLILGLYKNDKPIVEMGRVTNDSGFFISTFPPGNHQLPDQAAIVDKCKLQEGLS